LTAPDFATELYADVPQASGHVVEVRLQVDGYPRAFVFRVPVGVDSPVVAEEASLHEVRILEPAANTKLPAPQAAIHASLQIDAPVGSFQSDDDFVEVGIDADLDREFRGERTVKLRSDRQSAVRLTGCSPDGVMRVHADVRDYELVLPVAGMQNVAVNVLARLVASGKESWSEPVEMMLDAAGPEITEVTLTPDQDMVEIGKELQVAVGVTDHDGSGVGKVEMAFDVAGAGEFGAAPPPVEAVAQSQAVWIGKLDTSALQPANYTILVRATDVVGNASNYVEVKNVKVVTPEMAAESRRQETNRVYGTVRFGEEPAAGMKMTLESLEPDGPSVEPVIADESGDFMFPAVPPGKYQLLAEGKIRNGGRSIVVPPDEDHYEVTVGPPSGGVVQLKDVKVR
jgi:hypothetical protein